MPAAAPEGDVDPSFVAEVRAFLEAHAPRQVDAPAVWGHGPDDVLAFDEPDMSAQRADLDVARSWRRTLVDADLHWVEGPRHLGGRGLPPGHEEILQESCAQYAVPDERVLAVGLHVVCPSVLDHGSPRAVERWAAGLRRGDVVGCQLFSEPESGSDLAGVRTRAVRDGDGWVLEGQKVWTSGAQLADIGMVLARSDPQADKHRGMSMFVVEMAQPGVEVRPIRQMTGAATFNEVFLSGARVHEAEPLGGPGAGWRVAMNALGHERRAMGAGRTSGLPALPRLRQLVAWSDAGRDPAIRTRLADIEVAALGWRVLAERAAHGLVASGTGPETALAKLALTELLRAISDLAADVLGERLIADSGEWGTFAWSRFIAGVPGMRLAGGTDEILRTVVGERVLNLPREPRLPTVPTVSADVPSGTCPTEESP